MKETNSSMVIEDSHIDSEGMFMQSASNESMEKFSDYYNESGFFFKGAVFGLLLCLPFWAVVFWLIN